MSIDVNSTLFNACRRGDLQQVEDILSRHTLSDYPAWSEGYTLLRQAIDNRNIEIAKLLLLRGAKVNTGTNAWKLNSNTPLHLAACTKDVELVKFLLLRCAAVDAKNEQGKTPLHLAVQNGNEEIVELLLASKASVETSDQEGNTPLSLALMDGNEKISQLLTDCRDAISKSFPKSAMLYSAVGDGHVNIVKYFLQNGADCNCEYTFKETAGLRKTALYLAIELDNKCIVQLLLQHNARLSSSFDRDSSLLHLAILHDSRQVFKFLLKSEDIEKRDHNGSTVLHRAAEKGDELIIQLLLDHNADITAKDSTGFSTLHKAVENGNETIVKLLLDKGSCVDDRSRTLNTPLHLAIKKGHEHLVKLLLERGADVNTTDIDKKTALCFAAEEGNVKVLECLLQFKPNVENEINRSALGLAIMKGTSHKQIVYRLLVYGFVVSSESINSYKLFLSSVIGCHLIVVKNLLERGSNVKNRGKILYKALQRDHQEIIRLLLNHGFLQAKDPNIDSEKKSEKCFLHVVVEKRDEKYTKFALEHGADVNSTGDLDFTALHIACRSGYLPIVKLLLEYEADVNKKDEDGLTPLHVAIRAGNHHVIRHLLLHTELEVNASTNYKSTHLHYAVLYFQEWRNDSRMLINSLLRLGADITARDENDRTPFCHAIEGRNNYAVKAFLDKNPDINDINNKFAFYKAILCSSRTQGTVSIFFNRSFAVKSEDFDNFQMPKFMYAMYEKYSSFDQTITIVENLFNRKATPNVFMEYYVLTTCVAKGFCKSLKHLWRQGMNVNALLENEQTLLHLACENDVNAEVSKNIIKELLKLGANIDAKDSNDSTPLHESSCYQTGDIVGLLLKHGADIEAMNKKDESPLHIALQRNHLNVQVLVDFGASVNSANRYGRRPLHVAVKKGCEYCVNLLLYHDADINVEDNRHQSPLYLAAKLGKRSIVEIFLANGAIVNRNVYQLANYTVRSLKDVLLNHQIKLAEIINIEICSLGDKDVEFRMKCREEIERMKCVEIGYNISLCDVLRKEENVVTRYARNESLLQILEAVEYEVQFPIYGRMLRTRVLKAKKKNQLTNLGAFCLETILKKRIPALIIDEIFSYVNNLDLRNLIYAAPIDDDEKAYVRYDGSGVRCEFCHNF